MSAGIGQFPPFWPNALAGIVALEEGYRQGIFNLEFFQDLKCDGGTGGGDYTSKTVYAYKKYSHKSLGY